VIVEPDGAVEDLLVGANQAEVKVGVVRGMILKPMEQHDLIIAGGGDALDGLLDLAQRGHPRVQQQRHTGLCGVLEEVGVDEIARVDAEAGSAYGNLEIDARGIEDIDAEGDPALGGAILEILPLLLREAELLIDPVPLVARNREGVRVHTLELHRVRARSCGGTDHLQGDLVIPGVVVGPLGDDVCRLTGPHALSDQGDRFHDSLPLECPGMGAGRTPGRAPPDITSVPARPRRASPR
jgi:hypothetical protein